MLIFQKTILEIVFSKWDVFLKKMSTSRDCISRTKRSQKKSKVSGSIYVTRAIDSARQNLYIRRLDRYIIYIQKKTAHVLHRCSIRIIYIHITFLEILGNFRLILSIYNVFDRFLKKFQTFWAYITLYMVIDPCRSETLEKIGFV